MTSSPARSITAPSAAPVLNSICVLPPSGSDPTKKKKKKPTSADDLIHPELQTKT